MSLLNLHNPAQERNQPISKRMFNISTLPLQSTPAPVVASIPQFQISITLPFPLSATLSLIQVQHNNTSKEGVRKSKWFTSRWLSWSCIGASSSQEKYSLAWFRTSCWCWCKILVTVLLLQKTCCLPAHCWQDNRAICGLGRGLDLGRWENLESPFLLPF